MNIYNKVSDLKNIHVDRISMHYPYINGTTIANTSLFPKTLRMMTSQICHITTTDSAYYTNNPDILSCLGFKKRNMLNFYPI